MIRILFLFLSFLFACLSGQAQHVAYHGSKHYNMKVNQFRREGALPEGAIIMLGDSHSEYGGDWNRFSQMRQRLLTEESSAMTVTVFTAGSIRCCLTSLTRYSLSVASTT